MVQILNKNEYLKYLPFLAHSETVISRLQITIEKIDNTNVYDPILIEIFNELCTLVKTGILKYELMDSIYEVTKFYLTILVLQGLDNIALTRIWVRYIMEKTELNIISLISQDETENINIFVDIYRLLELDNHFELKKITIGKDSLFGMSMLKYLDVATQIQNSDEERYRRLILVNCTLFKGMVLIGYHEIDRLSAFIEYFAKLRVFALYNQVHDMDHQRVTLSSKLTRIIKHIKQVIIESKDVSINVKKHHVPKDLLYEQEKIKNVEQSNIIIKEILDNKQEFKTVATFPPCVNVILTKLLIKKIPLSHNENILLCTYLAKKNFVKEQVIKIFSKAVNFDPKVTAYQVRSLIDKNMMCMNCNNLQTEGICHKELDKTNQCHRIKNPLSFR